MHKNLVNMFKFHIKNFNLFFASMIFCVLPFSETTYKIDTQFVI